LFWVQGEYIIVPVLVQLNRQSY